MPQFSSLFNEGHIHAMPQQRQLLFAKIAQAAHMEGIFCYGLGLYLLLSFSFSFLFIFIFLWMTP